jgi:DNA repair exonuclease SbcCD nuclease subunit
MKAMKVKPIAVLTSDVHYNVQTLPLADAAMRQAIAKANSLNVPLIVAGDLHDTKANLRAECINAIQETFASADIQPYVLRGNHDSVNEKSIEHALNFLAGLAVIVDIPQFHPTLNLNLIPYQYDPLVFKTLVSHGTINIVHQGITGSHSGEYIQDKSAITRQDVAGFRVISGHYHTRQTIDLPNGSKWDYIGNPYTLNYGEANDPEKGFQILMDDGSLEFVPTNLRKHIVLEQSVYDVEGPNKSFSDKDLVWVKLSGTKEELISYNKGKVSRQFGISQPFRLDLISTDTETQVPDNKQNMTQGELLDSLIDSLTNTSDDVKGRLKNKWKDLK